MAPADLRTARKALGLSQKELAKALRMGEHGWQSVSRWERDGSSIPGPAQVAVECLLRHGENSKGSQMSDELDVWREASDAASKNAVKWKPAAADRAAAVIRDYGDKRYQQAIADVVEWLGERQRESLNGHVLAGAALDITRRFGKGQDHG